MRDAGPDCLDEPTVLAFLAGQIGGDGVDAHLASCPACCELVVHAARTSFAAGTPARAEPTPSVADTMPAAPRAKTDGDRATPAERYTIETLIGSGGQALVYKAHDNVLGRLIALKLLRDTRDAGVLDEARLAAKLNHPNIVAIHDAGRLPCTTSPSTGSRTSGACTTCTRRPCRGGSRRRARKSWRTRAST